MIKSLGNLDPELEALDITPQDIVNSLTLEDVHRFLISLGVTQIAVNKEKEYIICPTICHNPLEDANSMKLYWYHDNKIFRCYTECNEAMSIFTLYRKFYSVNSNLEITFPQAVEYVKSIINHEIIKSIPIDDDEELDISKYQFSANVPQLPEYPKETINYFTKYYHPTWLRDGILPEVMDKFNIRFSLAQNKIIIPHYDINDRLIGIRGRALEQSEIENFGKYRPVQIGDTLYTHSLQFNLYGINKHKDAIQRSRIAIIAEAEKSVLLDDGYNDDYSVTVACCGSNINKYHISLLSQLGINELVIALDKEYTDNYDEQAKKYRKKLVDICQTYSTLINCSYIWDYEGLLEEKDSPYDKGKDVFQYLFKNRIKVR